MNRLWLKLIRVDESFAEPSSIDWFFTRPWVAIVGGLLLIPIAWWIVQRHARALPHLSVRSRTMLSVCRVGVLALLVLVLADPHVRLTSTVEHKPVVALIVDESASMKLPAGVYDDADAAEPLIAATRVKSLDDLNTRSRLDLARAALGLQDDLIDDLSQRFELRAYRLGRKTIREVDIVSITGDTDATSFADDETAIGDALRRVVDDAAGRTVAAVILVSDGRSTFGSDPRQVVRGWAARDGDQGRPIWAVPVGSDVTAPDAVLLDVLSPGRVTQGDTAAVIATVGSTGLSDRKVQVDLVRGDDVIDSSSITLQDAERRQVQLDYRAATPGRHALTVRVSPQPEEQVKQNNAQTIEVETSDDRFKVLYLESVPRWDFRFLDHALRRDGGTDATLVMSSQLRAAGVEPDDLPAAAKLPRDVDGWSDYHVVILGDVSPALLTSAAQKSLVEAVRRRAVGLIVQAGPTAMPHAFAAGPLNDLLPVNVRRTSDARGAPGGVEAPAYAPFRLKLSGEGALHPAFQLYDSGPKNRAVWDLMPTFFWSSDVVEARPGATVLARRVAARDETPLIAEQPAGKGRVFYVGYDATFRWRRNIGEHVFERFWGQAIRRVARPQDKDAKQSRIEVTPQRAEPGEPVAVELYAVDAGGEPIDAEMVKVKVTRDGAAGDGESLTLKRTGPGRYRAVWRAESSGRFALTYDGVSRSNASVRIAGSGRELRRPIVDRDTLGAIGDATGGGLIELDQLATLADRIEGEVTRDTRTIERAVWDHWLTLVLIVGLYCVDVGIRRMTGSM